MNDNTNLNDKPKRNYTREIIIITGMGLIGLLLVSIPFIKKRPDLNHNITSIVRNENELVKEDLNREIHLLNNGTINQISYRYTDKYTNVKELRAMFIKHINFNHPKGYYIIQTIEELDYPELIVGVWNVILEPHEYIDNIHLSMPTEKSGTEVKYRIPQDEEARNVFRTAEAMILTYHYTGKRILTEEELEPFAAQMIHRKHGNPIQ